MSNSLVVVLADSAAWAAWSVVVGYLASRIPADRLHHDGFLTRLRSWERDGRVYEQLAIRSWKDRLPEAGGTFGDGMPKSRLPGRSTDDLHRFMAEARRAELVHWAIPLLLPVLALWNPPGLFAAMVVFAVVANVPCLIIQRYNRARIARILARREGRVVLAHAA